MVVRMRHTRSQRGNTRSHHALQAASLGLCPKCGLPKLPHAVCGNCGLYKGRQIIDVHASIARHEKRAKEKAKRAK